MSTLNKNELKHLAIHNSLLGNDYLDSNFQASSYDLRIGAIFKNDEIFSKDFQKPGFTNSIDIKPSEIISMLTLEKIRIPLDCMGTVFSINKHSSIGLLILNPGHVDPGYEGYITICAINLSKEVRTISIGESIFTLIIQKLNSPLTSADGYQNKVMNSRKEEEQLFLKNKSKKLSNSIFDLVNNYDGAKKALVQKLWDYLISKISATIKIIVFIATIAGILALGYNMFPDYMPVFKKEQNKEAHFNKKIDSTLRSKDIEIQKLNDSIKKLSKK